MGKRAFGEQVEERRHRLHLADREPFSVDAVQPHGVAAAPGRVDLGVVVGEVHHRALAEHHVVVEVVREPFPQLQRVLVEVRVRLQQVVRAHDGGVASGVAAAEPALLHHRDVGDAVKPGEVVRRRQTVAAAADDDHVVLALGLRAAPCQRPPLVVAERVSREAEDRIAHAGRLSEGPAATIHAIDRIVSGEAEDRCATDRCATAACGSRRSASRAFGFRSRMNRREAGGGWMDAAAGMVQGDPEPRRESARQGRPRHGRQDKEATRTSHTPALASAAAAAPFRA